MQHPARANKRRIRREAVIVFQNLHSNNSALPVTILCLLLLLGFGGLLIQTGCNPNSNSARTGQGYNRQYTTVDRNSAEAPRLTIGSFNIQSLGKTKMSKPEVVQILVDITRRFDILAVQELRDKDQNVIPEFLDLINADGRKYAAAVGPRQGYNIEGNKYFEQSVFIYDTTKVELIAPTYAAHDPDGIMHRSPYVGYFQSIEVNPADAFKFVLMNVHVDYDNPHLEFEAMREIIAGIYDNHKGEDDFILVGDLNDEPDRYRKYAWMNDQHPAIPNQWKTNLVQTENYDNIVFDALRTSEFTRQSGVLDLMSDYNLSITEAKKVSDHLPVWATFSAFESPSAAITQGGAQGVIR